MTLLGPKLSDSSTVCENYPNYLVWIFTPRVTFFIIAIDLVDLLDHFIILICKAPNGIFGFIAPAEKRDLADF